MIGRALLATCLLGGCSAAVDPCAGKSGACLAVHVAGDGVTTLDQLVLQLSGAVQLDGTTPPSPTGTFELPAAVAILLPPGRSGAVALHADGLLAGRRLGAGDAQTLLVGGGGRIDVTLRPGQLPADGGPPDGARSDGGPPVDGAAADLAGAPTIASVSPPLGPTTGGIAMTILGNNFANGATVTIDGLPLGMAQVSAPDKITGLLPAHLGALGPVPVVVRNPDGGSASALFRYYAGQLQLAPPTTTVTTGMARSVTLGDWNGDKVLDVALGMQSAPSLQILLGKGDAMTFTKSATYATSNDTHQVIEGDWNGDKIPDLLTADQNIAVATPFLGKGDGTFTAAATLPVPMGATGGTAGDLNGDKLPDVALASYSSNRVLVFFGKGNGTFSAGPVLTVGGMPWTVQAGDLDGNGTLDLAVVGTTGGLEVLLNTGGGAFAAPVTYPVSSPHDLVLADLDLDGRLDAVVASDVGGAYVLRGLGNGTFGAAVAYPTGNAAPAFAVAVGDVDGDLLPEVLVSSSMGPVTLLRNLGGGKLGAPVNFTLPSPARGAAFGDLDKDGRLDVAIALFGTMNDGGLAVLHNLSR